MNSMKRQKYMTLEDETLGWYVSNILLKSCQSTLIQGPNIPGSYVTLFFTALDSIFTTRHIHS